MTARPHSTPARRATATLAVLMGLGLASGVPAWAADDVAQDRLVVTDGGQDLLNMRPGEIRVMTTAIFNPTRLDAQVSTVATATGDVGSEAGHILLTVDSCTVAWTALDSGDLSCVGGETRVLSDWAVMGTTYADSTFRVNTGETVYLRTQIRLGDNAPQNMQGLRGDLSYAFASVEAPPRIPVDPVPAEPVPAQPVAVPVSAPVPQVVAPVVAPEKIDPPITARIIDRLPRTGSEVVALVGVAAFMVGAGALLVTAARRRRVVLGALAQEDAS